MMMMIFIPTVGKRELSGLDLDKKKTEQEEDVSMYEKDWGNERKKETTIN